MIRTSEVYHKVLIPVKEFLIVKATLTVIYWDKVVGLNQSNHYKGDCLLGEG
jgi:hypothetical protein